MPITIKSNSSGNESSAADDMMENTHSQQLHQYLWNSTAKQFLEDKRSDLVVVSSSLSVLCSIYFVSKKTLVFLCVVIASVVHKHWDLHKLQYATDVYCVR